MSFLFFLSFSSLPFLSFLFRFFFFFKEKRRKVDADDFDLSPKLRCQVDLCVFIDVEFEWKLQRIISFDETVNIDSFEQLQLRKHSTTTPHRIGQFDIEIKLLKNHHPKKKPWLTPTNHNHHDGRLLVDDDDAAAFQPKIYTITLEQGNLLFYDAMYFNQDASRFALRLVFDQSPYPPPPPPQQQKWTLSQEEEPPRVGGGPDAMTVPKMWEWKVFYAREAAAAVSLSSE